MMRKLLRVLSYGDKAHEVKLYKDSDTQEFIARVFRNGKVYEPADYFTPDYSDALGSGADMLRRETGENEMRKKNPASIHNIEKSAFHKGEYVGYAVGTVWKIIKGGEGYRAIAREHYTDSTYPPQLTARTLRDLSVKLDGLYKNNVTRKQNPLKPQSRADFILLKDAQDLLDIYKEQGKAATQKHYELIVKQEKLSAGAAAALANKFEQLLKMDREVAASLGVQQGRKVNPVPLSKAAQHKKAENLYRNFTGHKAADVTVVDKPAVPDVMSVIGEIDGIMYSTVRDGKHEKYCHQFRKKSRPLFAVSPDGNMIYILGGAYKFGERGIIDK